MLGSRSTDVGQKTECGRHVTSSPCIVTYSLPHAKLKILISEKERNQIVPETP